MTGQYDFEPGEFVEFVIDSTPGFRSSLNAYLALNAVLEKAMIPSGSRCRIIRKLEKPEASSPSFLFGQLPDPFYWVDVSALNLTVDTGLLCTLAVYGPALKRLPALLQLAEAINEDEVCE